MARWRNMLRQSVVTAVMLGGLTTSAWGQAPGGGFGSFGGEFRGLTQFTGQVVCVGCSLEEARAAQPRLRNLHQLNHGREQVVMQIESFADPSDQHYWQTVVGLTDKVSVRAADHIFVELTSEENLFKEITVTGILRSTRTLDIGGVEVKG